MLQLSNGSKINTLERERNGTATIRARLILADNSVQISKMYDSYGNIVIDNNGMPKTEKVIINDDFINTLKLNYDKSTKRKFMIGKQKFPRVMVEHIDTLGGQVGQAIGKLDIVKEKINGVYTNSLVGNMLLFNEDIINDIEENGLDSKYSKVSLGIEDPTGNPTIEEYSLTSSPRIKGAMLLSENDNSNVYFSDIRDAEKINRYLQKLQAAETRLNLAEEKRNESIKRLNEIKNRKEIEQKIKKLLNTQVFLNKITRRESSLIMGKLRFNDQELELLSNIFPILPSGRMNLSTKFSSGEE